MAQKTKELKTEHIPFITMKRNHVVQMENKKIQMKNEKKMKRKSIEAARKYLFKRRLKKVVVLTTLFVTLGVVGTIKFSHIIISNANNNVQHYEDTILDEESKHENITEKVCKVIRLEKEEETNKDIVVVEYNEESYSFYSEEQSEYKYIIGETVLCRFSDNMEIVDVEH